PFEKRMSKNRAAKEAVARLAAETIGDGQSVMLDTGTTTSYLARALPGHRRLTVGTNSFDVARPPPTVTGHKVYTAGRRPRVDQPVLRPRLRRVVVTDASKFAQNGLVQVCPLATIDELIVEQPPVEPLAEALQAAEVMVRVAGL